MSFSNILTDIFPSSSLPLHVWSSLSPTQLNPPIFPFLLFYNLYYVIHFSNISFFHHYFYFPDFCGYYRWNTSKNVELGMTDENMPHLFQYCCLNKTWSMTISIDMLSWEWGTPGGSVLVTELLREGELVISRDEFLT